MPECRGGESAFVCPGTAAPTPPSSGAADTAATPVVWNLAVEQHALAPGPGGRPGYWSSAGSSPRRGRNRGWPPGPRRCSSRRCGTRGQGGVRRPGNPARRPTWRKAGGTRGSGWWGTRPPVGCAAACRRRSARSGCRRAGGCGSAGPAGAGGGEVYRVTGTEPGAGMSRSRHPGAGPRRHRRGGRDRPGRGRICGLVHGGDAARPGLTARERTRLRRLERKLSRAKRGSGRREQVRRAMARLRARETDRRKDWAEKASTDIARRFDVIRVEDLKISDMTRSRKARRRTRPERPRRRRGSTGASCGPGGDCWCAARGQGAGRVEKINAAHQPACSACGQVDALAREPSARVHACGYAARCERGQEHRGGQP